jgi:hypothetical protein
MKNLRHLTRRQSEIIGNAIDATKSEPLSSGNDVLKTSYQPPASVTETKTLADRIRISCLYILLFALTSHAVFGEIKNGYEKNIVGSKESLNNLRTALAEDGNLTPVQRRRVQSKITTLVNHVSYYELTESLLRQFKTIAPELYADIDNITDRLGRPVDVYIKFVPIDGTDIKAEGTTYMNQSADDPDMSISEFGELTVSVKVWIVQRSLLVLAHELGHVKYQVPNLASYFVYHKKNYSSTTNSMGHNADDPSGQSASACGKSFQKIYVDFLKLSNDRVQSPLAILARLKKDWSKNT